MITELEIEGFKSFGYPAEPLHLGKLNFLVGANASGKSNLIAALQFLQNAVLRDVKFAVNELGGVEEVRNRIFNGQDDINRILFRIKMDIPRIYKPVPVNKGQMEIIFPPPEVMTLDYDLQVGFKNDPDSLIIVSENLREIQSTDTQREYVLKRNSHKLEITDTDSECLTRSLDIPDIDSFRPAVSAGGYVGLPCAYFRDVLQDWYFFNITPDIARKSYLESSDTDLGNSGENLAVILHKIQKDPNGVDLEAIINGMQGVIPGFSDIHPVQSAYENKWAYQIIEDKIKGALNPESASDGTIRLLAMLVIAQWVSKKASFIAIEEPENGLHPHLAEHLVTIFRDASEHSQFLITTHNPSFLDYLEPEEVLLCDKVDGLTKIRRASDVEEINIFRKRFSLGELWTQGALGGIP